VHVQVSRDTDHAFPCAPDAGAPRTPRTYSWHAISNVEAAAAKRGRFSYMARFTTASLLVERNSCPMEL
jgi:hypothetical protein